MDWRKSSYSGAQGGQCVEVASAHVVMVRDSTDRTGGTLSFSAPAWASLVARIKQQ